MNTISQALIPFGDSILLVVRLIVGATMIYYGWPKIKDLKSNAENFVKMGFKPGWLWGGIVAAVETIGGIAIILGMYVPVVAVLFGFEMLLGTFWKIAKTDKLFTDWSYDLLFLAIMLLLLLTGPGSIAL